MNNLKMIRTFTRSVIAEHADAGHRSHAHMYWCSRVCWGPHCWIALGVLDSRVWWSGVLVDVDCHCGCHELVQPERWPRGNNKRSLAAHRIRWRDVQVSTHRQLAKVVTWQCWRGKAWWPARHCISRWEEGFIKLWSRIEITIFSITLCKMWFYINLFGEH